MYQLLGDADQGIRLSRVGIGKESDLKIRSAKVMQRTCFHGKIFNIAVLQNINHEHKRLFSVSVYLCNKHLH